MKKYMSMILISIILLPICVLLFKPVLNYFNKDLALSELEVESDHVASWISGTIQNKSNKEYKNVTVYVTLKNGDIKKECNFVIYETIEPKSTKDFHELLYDCDGNLENYKVIKKKIDTN